MVAQTEAGDPLWRCSGTLISPTIYITAGHCTFGAEHVEIWFQSDLEPDPAALGYPFTGQVGGTPYTLATNRALFSMVSLWSMSREFTPICFQSCRLREPWACPHYVSRTSPV